MQDGVYMEAFRILPHSMLHEAATRWSYVGWIDWMEIDEVEDAESSRRQVSKVNLN